MLLYKTNSVKRKSPTTFPFGHCLSNNLRALRSEQFTLTITLMIAVGSVTNGSHLFLQDLLPHRVHAIPWSICVLITHSVNFVSRHASFSSLHHWLAAFGVLHPLF